MALMKNYFSNYIYLGSWGDAQARKAKSAST